MSPRVTVTPEEFETLSQQAQAYARTKQTLKKRSKSLIEREMSVSSREALVNSREALDERNRSLTEENSLLRDQLSTEKDKNIELEGKIRGLAVYANDRQLLNDTRAELENTRSQLATEQAEYEKTRRKLVKEKEEHERTKGKLQAQTLRFETVVRGARTLIKYLYQKFDSKKKVLCEVTIQEFADFLEKIPFSQQQTKNKAVEQKRGPER